MTHHNNHYLQQAQRKDQHVGLATQQYQANPANHFQEMRFVHHSLPECSVADVSLQTSVGTLSFELPYFISAMTGGSEQTTALNQRLAIIARETGLAMACGSVSIAMNYQEAIEGFKIIRKENPNGTIIANLGAHHTVENAQRAIDLLEADALQIHINAPQELIMPEGDRSFTGWLHSIEQIVQHVSVPVMVKEVGFGMSRQTIAQLASVGVAIVDVAGTGGTNFAQIENARRSTNSYDALLSWGQSTVISLLEAMSIPNEKRPEIIASGGIKGPFDIIKSLALGAKLVGVSGQILQMARTKNSEEHAIKTLHEWREQLITIMTLLGAQSISELHTTDIILPIDVAHWCEARGIDWRHYANRSNMMVD